MICQYCGKNHDKFRHCPTCGAPAPEAVKPDDRGGWYEFINGYIVWFLRDFSRTNLQVYFYLGDRLVEHFDFDMDLVRERLGIGENSPGFGINDFIWNLFRLAQGEDEVLRIEEQNKRYPAVFEVRHIPHPEKQRWNSLTMIEVANEVRR